MTTRNQELEKALREAAKPNGSMEVDSHFHDGMRTVSNILSPHITECPGGGYIIVIDDEMAARSTLQEAFEYAAEFARTKFQQEVNMVKRRWWRLWRIK